MISENRKNYVEKCRSENEAELKEKYLLKYERNKKGERVGVVLAFKDAEGVVKIGWSRCHTKLEPFNKYIGVNKAVKRAVGLDTYGYVNELSLAPRSAVELIENMEARARNYFRTGGERAKSESLSELIIEASGR